MTKALDAAIEAAQERYDAGEDDDVAIAAALRAALPAEPTDWFLETMSYHHIVGLNAHAAWARMRRHILGEDDITEDRRPWDEYAGEDA